MATQNGINVTFSVTVVSISDFNIVSEHSTNRGNGQKIEISSAFSTLLVHNKLANKLATTDSVNYRKTSRCSA